MDGKRHENRVNTTNRSGVLILKGEMEMIKSKDGNTGFNLGNGELKMRNVILNKKVHMPTEHTVNWDTNEFEVEEINLKEGFIRLSKIK